MANEAIAEAVAAWRKATALLVEAARGLDEAALDRPSACGEWTNRQLLAHIATGYAMRRNWLRAAVLGEPLLPRAAGDAANAARIDELAGAGLERIEATLVAERAEIDGLLARLTPDALDLVIERSAGPGTLRDALRDFSQHDLDHAEELR